MFKSKQKSRDQPVRIAQRTCQSKYVPSKKLNWWSLLQEEIIEKFVHS